MVEERLANNILKIYSLGIAVEFIMLALLIVGVIVGGTILFR